MSVARNAKYVIRLVGAALKDPKRARGIYYNFLHGPNQNRFIAEQIIRKKVQIQDWRDALDEWELIDNPDRYKMMELYQEIELDDQVTAKTQAVQLRISGTEYYFYDNKTKKELPDLKTSVFDKRWFLDFLNHTVDAIFYGHSLIQFGDWNVKKGYDHKQMEIVPRYLVCPEKGIVKHRSGDTSGIEFRGGNPFARHLVEIGGKKDKGLFASLAPLFIFKKNSLSFWQDFQQRYGEPILQIATDTMTSKNLDTYYDFILNRGNAGGLVTDVDDLVKILEAEKTDAYKVYWQLISLCNDGISKVLEGQTMTTDSSGGKYSGDVHADTALLFNLGRLKSIKYYINDELLPKMRRDGFDISDDEEFRWREFKNIDEIVNRIVKLANYFHFTPEEIYEMTGIKVDKEREEVGDARAGNSKTAPDPDDK